MLTNNGIVVAFRADGTPVVLRREKSRIFGSRVQIHRGTMFRNPSEGYIYDGSARAESLSEWFNKGYRLVAVQVEAVLVSGTIKKAVGRLAAIVSSRDRSLRFVTGPCSDAELITAGWNRSLVSVHDADSAVDVLKALRTPA